jgi:hypothetical protein
MLQASSSRISGKILSLYLEVGGKVRNSNSLSGPNESLVGRRYLQL